jgi:signal transduction histidine kinase
MTRRLLTGYLSLTVFLLLVLALPLGVSFARAERRHLVDDVRHDALVLAMQVQGRLHGAEADGLRALAAEYRQRTGGRVTFVDAFGDVLADSDPPVSGPRNFESRPEVAAALRNQEATGVRHSNTLGHDLVYVAIPVTSNGRVEGVVRITYPSSYVDQRILRRWLSLVGVGILALGIAFLVIMQLTRSVVGPLRELEATASRLGQGDLGARARVPAGPPEARTLAEVLNTSAQKLERLVGSQRVFVADASHQLRTPLAALRLRLENLEADVPAAAREDLDGAIAEVWRLSRLVDGLLTVARAEQAGPARQAVDLQAIVAERHASWIALAEEHTVRLEAWVQTPLLVLATPGHLEQVLDNLIANALEVSPPGGTIKVSARHVGEVAELHVVDQGPGMSAEQRARAFDRFWQGGASGGGGSGLGLAIVRELVMADGGTVELRPAPGNGLDATVRLQPARLRGVERLRRPERRRAPAPIRSGWTSEERGSAERPEIRA